MTWDLASVAPEVWMAGGYAIALVGLGHVIDWLARRAASMAEGGKVQGFKYHEDHDAWKCPEDQWLWPQSFDPDNRVMRYRATPTICNSCPVKDTCTTSHSGREIQRNVDVWPASEAAKFHRGIACLVVLMGLVWPLVTALSGPGATGLVVLGLSVVAAAVLSLPLWSHLRRTSVYLPDGMVATRTLDATLLEREAAAATYRARKSSYGSDRRSTKEVSR